MFQGSRQFAFSVRSQSCHLISINSNTPNGHRLRPKPFYIIFVRNKGIELNYKQESDDLDKWTMSSKRAIKILLSEFG